MLISESGEPLICDFGVSRMIILSQSINGQAIQIQQNSSTLRGTSRWMSPELLMPPDDVPPSHSKASDVWAFGMSSYVSFFLTKEFEYGSDYVSTLHKELLTKKRPYHLLNSDPPVIYAIVHGVLPKKDMCSRDWPSQYHETWKLCEECWLKDPQTRPTMATILERLNTIISQSKLLDSRYRDLSRVSVAPVKSRTELVVRPRSFPGRRRSFSSGAEHDFIPMEILSPRRESPAEVSSTPDVFSLGDSGICIYYKRLELTDSSLLFTI